MSKSINSTEPQSAGSYGEIASRAYEIWRERGCPDGSAEEDWRQAEQDIESLDTSLQT